MDTTDTEFVQCIRWAIKISLIITAVLSAAAFGGCDSKSRQRETTQARKTVSKSPDGPYYCKLAQGRIVIDGKLNEHSWSNAREITKFDLLGPQKVKAPDVTRVRLLWDKQYLYIAFVCDDEDVWSATKKHDGALWDGDVVELFVKPQHDSPRYYEFEISPNGTTFDAVYPIGRTSHDETDCLWESQIKTACTVNGTHGQRNDRDMGYVVEAAIPLKTLLGPGEFLEAGTSWTFAVCRYDYSKTRPQPLLCTSSPRSTHGFHSYEVYRKLIFTE